MPRTATLQRPVLVLAIACALGALGCGKSESGAPGPGAGGTGAGGNSGALGGSDAAGGGAGASTQSPVAGTGGAIGSGGRTTGTGGAAAPATGGAGGAGTGGKLGTGGASAAQASGGATSVPASGGSTAAGTGGRTTGTGGAAGGNSGTSATVPSAGCGKTPLASGRATVDVSGTSREYILKVPDGYDPNHPYRLIFGFHGAKYDDNWVADGGAPLTGPFFGIESEAKGGAIFVAPQAGSGGWGTQDLPFVDAMVAKFEAQLCVDKSRIFSVGFSMGAIMTLNIACNRSDVFRAVAPMSGQLPSPCPAGNHIAYWAAHGTSDTTISPSQGQAARDELIKRNHCTTQTSSPDANNCVTYQGCDQGYPVVWCTFSGQHEPAPFAGQAIWQFLAPL